MKAYKLFVITLLTAGSMHTEAAELATSRVREVAGVRFILPKASQKRSGKVCFRRR